MPEVIWAASESVSGFHFHVNGWTGHTQQAGSMHNVHMYSVQCTCTRCTCSETRPHVHMYTCMHSACFSSHDVRCCVHSMRVGLGCGCEWLEWTCTTCTRECTVHWIQAVYMCMQVAPKHAHSRCTVQFQSAHSTHQYTYMNSWVPMPAVSM